MIVLDTKALYIIHVNVKEEIRLRIYDCICGAFSLTAKSSCSMLRMNLKSQQGYMSYVPSMSMKSKSEYLMLVFFKMPFPFTVQLKILLLLELAFVISAIPH